METLIIYIRNHIPGNLTYQKNIADYYNQTLNHYKNWWKLDRNLSVHYGIWDKNTANFQESLQNTNKVLAKIAGITSKDKILDAGCGVGGSAFYLNLNHNAEVEGITLSEKQCEYAINAKSKIAPDANINFSIQDYTNTGFPDNSFDVIWAIESITSAPSKTSFAKEAFRLLVPGGRIIIADYFKTSKEDSGNLLEKWRKLWSMAPFLDTNSYINIFKESGFNLLSQHDVTNKIVPTAKRMYFSYLLGGPLAVAYNLFNTPTPFARNHYKSGLYQYKSLKKGLWTYNILLFTKE